MSAREMPPAGVLCDHEAGCITCGDTAVELEVLRVDDTRGLALCADAHGAHETVETGLVGDVHPGDRLLVHAGAALAHLDADDEVARA